MKAVDIVEYKRSILGIFHELTEIEIKVQVDTACGNPEKYLEMSAASIMAIQHCREILKTILKVNKNE